MSIDFNLTSKTNGDRFTANVSKDDVAKFNINVKAWIEDNDEISNVTWTTESGQGGISDTAIEDGVISGLVSFSQSGRTNISILLETLAGMKKKIWLVVGVEDGQVYQDDYGMCQ